MERRISLLMVLMVLMVSATGAVSVVAQGISTDRPGFIATTVVVSRSAFQLESGMTLESSSETDGGSLDQLILGEALIRFGLLERLELRAELPNHNSLSFGDELDIPTVDGFGDSRLGVKYQIGPMDEESSIDLVAIGMISIPTGSEAFTSDEVDPEITLAASKVLGPKLGVSGQVVTSMPGTLDGRVFEWGLSLSGTTVLGSLALFVEFKVDFPDGVSAPVLLQTGLVLPIGSSFQLDVRGALGISDTAPDSIIGAGFAIII